MSNAAERRFEKRHPILVAHVTRADGSQARALRVYCGGRGASVPLATCLECRRCHEVREANGGSQGWVLCTPPVSTRSESEPIRVGDALHGGIVGVEEDVLVCEVVALFIELKLHAVVVTDKMGKFMGLVHESDLLPEILARGAVPHQRVARPLGSVRAADQPAAAVMSSIRPVPESMSLREAVTEMAAEHHRQILAVDDEGLPIGMLADFEALHALFAVDPE